MSEKCAGFITKWLINCEVIQEEEYDLYMYAAHSFIMTLVPLGSTLVVGAILGRIVSAVAIILPFMIIRKFSGGYHAQRAWICLISSTIILCGCIWASEYITYGYGLGVVMIAAAISLMINSPIDSENRKLDAQERRVYRKVTIVLVILNVLISLICYVGGRESVAIDLAVGVILTGGLQMPRLLRRFIK